MNIFLFPGHSKMRSWSREYKTCILSINSRNNSYSDGDSFGLRNARYLRLRTTFLPERRCCVRLHEIFKCCKVCARLKTCFVIFF